MRLDGRSGLMTTLACMLLLSVPAVSPSGATPCPANSIHWGCLSFGGDSVSNAASLNVGCSDVTGNGNGRYDLHAGSLAANGRGGSYSAEYGEVTAEDEYTLAGPVSGTPASITARLDVDGGSGGHAAAYGYLQEGTTSNRKDFYVPSGNYLTQSFSITLGVVSCSPFRLRFYMYAGGGEGGGAYLTGNLHFGNLPGGSSVVSCQGFAQTGPTAVSATTWGRLRNIYR